MGGGEGEQQSTSVCDTRQARIWILLYTALRTRPRRGWHRRIEPIGSILDLGPKSPVALALISVHGMAKRHEPPRGVGPECSTDTAVVGWRTAGLQQDHQLTAPVAFGSRGRIVARNRRGTRVGVEPPAKLLVRRRGVGNSVRS